MRCRVGVSTNHITLGFTEHDWAGIRMLMPAKVGHRSWMIMERDGGVVAERSSCGTGPYRLDRDPGTVLIGAKGLNVQTIVRCHVHEREVTFPRAGQMFVPMPPHHLWPWINDGRSRIKMSMDQWRWHLVQEINARLRSAKAAGASLDLCLPPWATKMLTTDEGYRLNVLNEEI